MMPQIPSFEFFQKTTTLILLLCFAIPFSSWGAGGVMTGTGTIESPYLVEDEFDLKQVASGEYSSGAVYRQTADIILSPVETVPRQITPGNTFSGTYLGGGHSIKGVRAQFGLFYMLDGATIDSLILLDVEISAIRVSSGIGGLAGSAGGKSNISNCFVTGTIEGGQSAGGIVGTLTDSSSISTSGSSVIITKTSNYAGGIVGLLRDTSKVIDVFSNSSVFVDAYSGGIVGYNYRSADTLYNLWSAGIVLAPTSTSSGAVIGTGTQPVVNGYWNNTLSGGKSGDYVHDGSSISELNNDEIALQSSFPGFDFTSTWTLSGSAYPTLQIFSDFLIAMPDTLIASPTDWEEMSTTTMQQLISNDQRADNASANLVARWLPFSYVDTLENVLEAYYQLGQVIAAEDTLWGVAGKVISPWTVTAKEIATYDELKRICASPNFPGNIDYRLTANIDASSSHTENEGMGMRPLCEDVYPFMGDFRGSGKTISNLKITGMEHAGLFAKVETGLIDSLNLVAIDVTSSHSGGGIAAITTSADIKHIMVSGTIRANSYGAGGIAGYSKSRISHVITDVEIYGNRYVGGIVGHQSELRDEDVFITHAIAKGTINASYNSAGGLVGVITGGGLENSISLADVYSREYTGGIAGWLQGTTIRNCWATGIVQGTNRISPTVGFGQVYANNLGLEKTWSNAEAYGQIQVGGVIGYNHQDEALFNGYWNVETSGIDSSSGVPAIDAGVGLSTSEMLDSLNYTDWDWENTWNIIVDESYPFLRNLNNPAFAFPDTISEFGISLDTEISTELISLVTANDIDPDDMQLELTARWAGQVKFDVIGELTKVRYQVGTIKGADTVWGMKSWIVFQNSGYIAIDTYEDLQSIGSHWNVPLNGSYKLTQDIDASPSASGEASDVYIPIGTQEKPFRGHLDGMGYSIRNLTINSGNYAGLFSYINNARIENLSLLNVDIESSGYSTAGLVSNADSSFIQGILVTGQIRGQNIGGIASRLNNSTLNQSGVSATLEATTGSVGGVVNIARNSRIFSCFQTGKSSAPDGSASGLVGMGEEALNLSNSYSTAWINDSRYSSGVIGGTNENTLIDSVWTAAMQPSGFYHNGFVRYINHEADSVIHGIWSTEINPGANGIVTNKGYAAIDSMSINAMKKEESFAFLDFTNIWKIKEGSSYPALQNMENPPFSFPDTVFTAGDTTDLSVFLENDYDYETSGDDLFIQIDSVSSGSFHGSKYELSDLATSMDTIVVFYRVGEVIMSQDTLWGNYSQSLLIVNQKPHFVLTDTLEVLESVTRSIDFDSIATDPESLVEISILDSAEHGNITLKERVLSYATKSIDSDVLDSVYLLISDGARADSGWIYFSVLNNNIPTLSDTSLTVTSGDTLRFPLHGVIVGDEPLEYRITNAPRNGRAIIQGDSLVYWVDSFEGKDTLYATAKNTLGISSSVALIEINVEKNETSLIDASHLVNSFRVILIRNKTLLIELNLTKASVFSFQLVDITGRIALSTGAIKMNPGHNQFQLSLKNLNSGIYYLKSPQNATLKSQTILLSK